MSIENYLRNKYSYCSMSDKVFNLVHIEIEALTSQVVARDAVRNVSGRGSSEFDFEVFSKAVCKLLSDSD